MEMRAEELRKDRCSLTCLAHEPVAVEKRIEELLAHAVVGGEVLLEAQVHGRGRPVVAVVTFHFW